MEKKVKVLNMEILKRVINKHTQNRWSLMNEIEDLRKSNEKLKEQLEEVTQRLADERTYYMKQNEVPTISGDGEKFGHVKWNI